MLVAEGMNSRRSRRALVLCMAPCGSMGLGALSAIFIDVVELATFVGGLTLPFDWYALIARTPRLEPPWTPPALASAVGLRRLGRTALEGPQIARFSLASACRASAFCTPRGSRASFASSSACSCTAWSRLCASFSLVAAESSTALPLLRLS